MAAEEGNTLKSIQLFAFPTEDPQCENSPEPRKTCSRFPKSVLPQGTKSSQMKPTNYASFCILLIKHCKQNSRPTVESCMQTSGRVSDNRGFRFACLVAELRDKRIGEILWQIHVVRLKFLWWVDFWFALALLGSGSQV